MSEWFMELVLKTSDSARGRGFESLSLRHFYSSAEPASAQYIFSAWRSTQEAEGAPLLRE